MKNRVFPDVEATKQGRSPNFSLVEGRNHRASNLPKLSSTTVKTVGQSTLAKYPVATVGVGLLAGITIGWWIKRR